jgi:hypothetical protein
MSWSIGHHIIFDVVPGPGSIYVRPCFVKHISFFIVKVVPCMWFGESKQMALFFKKKFY